MNPGINHSALLASREGTTVGANPPLVRAFVALQLLGGAGMTLILLTAWLSSRIRRHCTWYSLCISWILSVISYVLLTFGGRQLGTEPGDGLCVTQAALIYAAPVLTACTTLAAVIQLFLSMTSLISQVSQRSTWRAFVLVVSPYIVWLVIFIETLLVGLRDLKNVQRNPSSLYCHIQNGSQGKLSALFVVAIMLIVVSFECYFGLVLYRNWRTFLALGEASNQALHMIFRTALFSFFGVLSIAISVAFIYDLEGPLPNVSIALIPIEAFVVFGTQVDLVHSWQFWRRGSAPPASLPLETKVKTSLDSV